MTPRDVSVVIPAVNEQPVVAGAVQSAIAAGAGEVVVVDGGSDDETASQAQAAGAVVIASPAGRARQQNAGAARCGGDVLLFLHADNRLASDCLDQICDVLPARSDHWGGAFVQRISGLDRSAAHRRWTYRCITRGNAWRVRWRGIAFGDQAIFVRRSVFDQVGGFPEQPLMEDLILSQRLRRIAWPLLLRGPVDVDARRWQQYGPLRQTARNTALQLLYAIGVPPARLCTHYRRHDYLE